MPTEASKLSLKKLNNEFQETIRNCFEFIFNHHMKKEERLGEDFSVGTLLRNNNRFTSGIWEAGRLGRPASQTKLIFHTLSFQPRLWAREKSLLFNTNH